MGWIYHDPDEWETVFDTTENSVSYGLKKRPAEEIAKIKEERRREHEESVLAEAAQILHKALGEKR